MLLKSCQSRVCGGERYIFPLANWYKWVHLKADRPTDLLLEFRETWCYYSSVGRITASNSVNHFMKCLGFISAELQYVATTNRSCYFSVMELRYNIWISTNMVAMWTVIDFCTNHATNRSLLFQALWFVFKSISDLRMCIHGCSAQSQFSLQTISGAPIQSCFTL